VLFAQHDNEFHMCRFSKQTVSIVPISTCACGNIYHGDVLNPNPLHEHKPLFLCHGARTWGIGHKCLECEFLCKRAWFARYSRNEPFFCGFLESSLYIHVLIFSEPGCLDSKRG